MQLVFWVFVPGPVLLILGLLIFNWRQRKHQVAAARSLPEQVNEEAAG